LPLSLAADSAKGYTIVERGLIFMACVDGFRVK